MRIILLFTCFLMVANAVSQETTAPIPAVANANLGVNQTASPKHLGRKDELKIDAFYLIFAGALNVSYERLINNESGFGVNLILSNGKEIDTKFSLTPFYRFYFGKRQPNTGFYFESFASVNTFNYDALISGGSNTYDPVSGYYNYSNPIFEKKTATDFALGLGLGAKWITSNGIILELNTGIGRNLLNDYSSGNKDKLPTSLKILGRGGVSIGYRF